SSCSLGSLQLSFVSIFPSGLKWTQQVMDVRGFKWEKERRRGHKRVRGIWRRGDLQNYHIKRGFPPTLEGAPDSEREASIMKIKTRTLAGVDLQEFCRKLAEFQSDPVLSPAARSRQLVRVFKSFRNFV
ncbi:hypothetical protein KUCAC02_013262, partial [Chaenocephalus aceratus]